ncbi:MAG: hypothetical protein M4579_001165 [Chaenotheca gracillima]|nr:MAG: hypothetical protein M4579_001165 [Chaenotheca gracillima]
MAQAFDPFTQSFTLLLEDGTPFNVTLTDLNTFNLYNIRICINYGAQLGASLLLFLVLLLLTKADRRMSILFVVNGLSLAFNFIRSLLQCLYFIGGFNVTYAYFSDDYSHVTASDYATSITADVFTLLVLLCIEFSLVLQVNVVCVTLRDIHRYGLMVLSSLIATIAIAFRLALVVLNSESILGAEDFLRWQWLASATNITTTISICFFCAVFALKLGIAIQQRRKMGLRQFGPMQVIFIMGCQTMIIPALFSILQYFTSVPELGANVLTLTAVFLPLSSIWASISLDSRNQSSNPLNRQQKMFSSYASGSTVIPLQSAEKGGSNVARGQISPSNTNLTHESIGARSKANTSLSSPGRAEEGSRVNDADRDLEAQGLGIHVDRTFTLHQNRS